MTSRPSATRRESPPGGRPRPNPEGLIEAPVPAEYPSASLMRVTHYVGNYLGIVDGLAELLYDIVSPDGGKLVIRGGRTFAESFGVSETDVLRTIGGQYDLAHPENLSFLWGMLNGQLRANGVAGGPTLLILRAIKTILEGTDTGSVGTVTSFRDAQLVLLEHGFDWIDSGVIGLPVLVDLAEALAAVGEVVRTLLAFEFPAIHQRIDLDSDGRWFLVIDGTYTVTLPATSAQLFEWRFHSTGSMTIALRLDEVTLVDATTIRLWHEGEGGRFARVPVDLLGSVDDLSLRDVRLGIHMRPSLGGDRTEHFGPNHLFREASYLRRDGERNVRVTLSVSGASVELRTNFATGIAALAYPGVWTVGGLENALERDIARGVNALDDDDLVERLPAEAQGIIDRALAFLEGVMPNADACSLAQVGLPPLSEGSAPFAFDDLTTEAVGHCLSIHNMEARTGSGGGTTPGPRDPGDIEPPDLPPGDYGWEQPLPRREGRPADELGRTATDRARSVAMALLAAAGSAPAATAYLQWADVDLERGTVRDKAAAPVLIKALRNVRKAGRADARFVFEEDGRPVSRKAVVRAVERAKRWFEPRAAPMPAPAMKTCAYRSESPIALTRGSPFDPAWVGLSTNCHVAARLYRLMREQGSFDGSGSVAIDGQDLEYEIAVDSQSIDFTGTLFPEEAENPRAAGLLLTDAAITVRRSSGDGEAVAYTGRVRVPLVPLLREPGCLPDDAVGTLIQNLECVESVTGGSVENGDVLLDLLYRHFVFLSLDRRPEAGLAVDPVSVLSGNEATLGVTDRDQLLAAVVTEAYAAVSPIPVLFDPYWFLGGSIREYHAEEGWIVMYKRYPLPLAL